MTRRRHCGCTQQRRPPCCCVTTMTCRCVCGACACWRGGIRLARLLRALDKILLSPTSTRTPRAPRATIIRHVVGAPGGTTRQNRAVVLLVAAAAAMATTAALITNPRSPGRSSLEQARSVGRRKAGRRGGARKGSQSIRRRAKAKVRGRSLPTTAIDDAHGRDRPV